MVALVWHQSLCKSSETINVCLTQKHHLNKGIIYLEFLIKWEEVAYTYYVQYMLRCTTLSFIAGSCYDSSKGQNENGRDSTDGEPVETFTHSTDTLCVLSWNIDGLDRKYTIERALAVCGVIDIRKPEVVYLQEIVPSTWQALTDRLGSTYLFYRDEVAFHYYHVLMVRKESTVTPTGDLEVLKFPNSQQGRHLLQLPVTFQGMEILLLTSHLESMNHHAAERRNQLKTAFSIMREAQEQQKLSIFAGDLNLLDKEVFSLPDNIVDVWEACGAQYKDKCTWESSDPRLRLDRAYFSTPADACTLRPTKFRLVGSSTVRGLGAYPSDHLGMWMEFSLQKADRVRVYSS